MYTSIYLHRVPRNNIEAFRRILGAAANIYHGHGALKRILYAPANMDPKYNCLPFDDVIKMADDESLFIEINEFYDQTHHDEVMTKADIDPQLSQLYEDLTVIVDISCIVRGEFKSVLLNA